MVITKKIKESAFVLDKQLLDHLIIVLEGCIVVREMKGLFDSSV